MVFDEVFDLFERRDSRALAPSRVVRHEANAAPHLVISALLHDIGHLPHGLPEEAWLHRAAALHVDAKQYLCSTEPKYLEELSSSSLKKLQLQGGPFSAGQARDFEHNPHFRDAVALRRWDDAAKVTELTVPDLRAYREILNAC
jgi:predicted HD phosphohydrolase